MKKIFSLLVTGLVLVPSMSMASFKIVPDSGFQSKSTPEYGKMYEYQNPYGNLKVSTPGYTQNDYSTPYRQVEEKKEEPKPQVIEITKVYQPYYTAISQDIEEGKSYGAIPNPNYSNNATAGNNVTNQQIVNQNIPYTRTEGTWILPFIMQDHTAKEKERILQTWGRVFRTPGFYPYNQLYTTNSTSNVSSNSSAKSEPAYLSTYSEYRKVNTQWAPRGQSGVIGTEGTGDNVTYRVR